MSEENLWSYHCLATGATLVLRDITARRVFRGTVWWLVLVLLAFEYVRFPQTPWWSWPSWFWQVTIKPSAFVRAFNSLRQTLREERVEIHSVDILDENVSET